MKQRIVVLGADGFIGRRVVQALARSDWAEAIAAGRRPTAGDPARVQVNATEVASLSAALKGAQGVVNCVSGSAETIRATTAALYQAAAASQPIVVDFSSMSVYGPATGSLDEDAPLLADTGPYAAAKADLEKAAQAYGRAVRLRPGIVYGGGSPQWSARVAQWLHMRRVGDLGADGDGLCNLVHVDDVAAAVLAALQTPAALGRAYNLSLPSPPTWNEYFMAYAQALGAVPVRRIPGWQFKLEKLAAIPLKVAEILAQKAKLKLALPPPIPPSMPGLWRQEIRLDPRRAEQELGLRWKPLAEGLRSS